MRLAAVRVAEMSAEQPRFWDPLAAAFAGESINPFITEAQRLQEGAAISFLDDQLLQAVDIVNMDLKKEYQQVVLLGCGFDSRPFRLPWPAGTVIFLLAPSEVHAAAIAKLKQSPNGVPRVPRGCLLQRVSIDLPICSDFSTPLEAAGYNGKKLSVWALQGLAKLGLSGSEINQLLAHIANSASLNSFIFGELPPSTVETAASWIAKAGFLGNIVSDSVSDTAEEGDISANSTDLQNTAKVHPTELDGRESDRHERGRQDLSAQLFIAQQQKLSLSQMQEYNRHSRAGEEDGEDFEGNFS